MTATTWSVVGVVVVTWTVTIWIVLSRRRQTNPYKFLGSLPSHQQFRPDDPTDPRHR